jgi:hypothetical protein
MNRKEVVIGKDKIVLSERLAVDVLGLTEMYEANKAHVNNASLNVVIYATVIEHSINSTLKTIPFYHFLDWLRHKKYNQSRLIKKLSISELTNLYIEVLELEGTDLKKKLKTADSQ